MYWVWSFINRTVHRDSRVETILSPVTSVRPIQCRKSKDNGVTNVSSNKFKLELFRKKRYWDYYVYRFIKEGFCLSMDGKDSFGKNKTIYFYLEQHSRH